jgi:hypothetical protein
MAEWYVRLRDAFKETVVGEYTLREPTCEVKNSEGGGFTGEIALGQKRRQSPNVGIGRDDFAPKRTWYELWRQSSGSGVCVSDGYLTSVNLNRDRDSILIAGEDWKSYLDHRVYPFAPEGYVEFDEDKEEMYWDKWPKKWAYPTGDFITSRVSVQRVVRDLMLSMRTGRPIDIKTATLNPSVLTQANALGVPSFPLSISFVGEGNDLHYKIYPGDQTTILGHLNAIGEAATYGFEWDVEPITRTFRMWQPRRYPLDVAVFAFAPSDDPNDGMVVDFDWTNEGPAGTYLLGLGQAERTGYKVGAIWSYDPALEQFGRYDLVYDYGTMVHPEYLLDKLKDQNDIWPQKKITFSLLNPEFLPMNFYTQGRPRNLIGNTVRVTKDFPPYHKVDAYFRINSIRWQVDASSNEVADLELMMIYEPETGLSGGIGGPGGTY